VVFSSFSYIGIRHPTQFYITGNRLNQGYSCTHPFRNADGISVLDFYFAESGKGSIISDQTLQGISWLATDSIIKSTVPFLNPTKLPYGNTQSSQPDYYIQFGVHESFFINFLVCIIIAEYTYKLCFIWNYNWRQCGNYRCHLE
jgi:hypothetical protein